MSDYKVPFTKILNIQPHPNADALEIVTVYGFQVIVRMGMYHTGDDVVYIPIDSILPTWLEERIFPHTKNEDGVLVPPKIKLTKSRVRQIRLRGLASQGMIIDLEDIRDKVGKITLEDDLAEKLGVVKYEPPQPKMGSVGVKKHRKKNHPLFHQYNGLTNIKWLPNIFSDEDRVVIQEKLHGCNARAGVLPYVATTWWKKILKWLRLAPKFEKCYGSNSVEKSMGKNYQHFYGTDVWGEVFSKLNVFDRLKVGECVYGEIVGPGIQANYDYGLKEHRFVLFDVKVLNAETNEMHWIDPLAVAIFAEERGFEMVPMLYNGLYNREIANALTKGPSKYGPSQKVREGVVIKAEEHYHYLNNKRAVKLVSEDYLSDATNSDNQ